MKWLVPYLLALALPVLAQTNAPAAAAASASERNIAGTIELIEGDVRVFDAAKTPRSVAKGDKVYEGESIVTGKDGEVHLDMEDSGFIGVRPDTRMRFTKYQANGEATDTSVIGLLKGAVRSVTGWIGKDNASAYQIRTPTAVVGVRGTDHETLVIPQGQGNADAGTYDKVNIGGTTLQTKQGKVDVEPDRAGFVSFRAGSRPQLLERVPRFFKPTRHESVFQGKHEAVRKVIEQRREEKRKIWQEKAAKRQAAKPGRPDQDKKTAKAHEGKHDGRHDSADQAREKREAERQKRAQERQNAAEERKHQKEERQKRNEAHKPDEHQKPGQDRGR
jgi:flagellar biosynthesis GTPase FlhF